MPRDADELRVLARAIGPGRERRRPHRALAADASSACAACTSASSTGRCCRRSPRCPTSGLELTSEQAEARLAAIGFRDPAGALAHIARAHRRGLAAGDDPAAPAAGAHAAVVRRRRRPRLRPARVPPTERRRSARRTGTCGMLRDSSGCRAAAHRACSRARGSSANCSSAPPRPSPGSRTTTSCGPRSLAAARRRDARGARPARRPRMPRRRSLRAIRRREVLRLALSAILDVLHRRGARPRALATSPRATCSRRCVAAIRGDGARRHRVRGHRAWAASAGASSASAPTPTSCTSTGRRTPSRGRPSRARCASSPSSCGSREDAAAAARPRRRPAPRGQERRRRPLARLVPRLLRALVAHLGGAGAAARPRRGRRRRRCSRDFIDARRHRALPGGDLRAATSARSSASRPASRTSGCRRAPTRRATSSSGAARSATSSGSCSCCSCSTAPTMPALRTTSTLDALAAAVGARPRRRPRCRDAARRLAVRVARALGDHALDSTRRPTCCPSTARSSRASRASWGTRRARRPGSRRTTSRSPVAPARCSSAASTAWSRSASPPTG